MSKTFGTNLTGKDGYNLFEIPFLVCFVLYSYVFVSLIGSKYFYEVPVIIFSTCIFVLWTMLCIIFEVKTSKRFCLSKTKFFILIVGLLLGFYYAKVIWFSGYLNLDPVATLFEGNSNIDTLFHTDIAESFITNRYPSIQFNASDFLHYHVVSHFILACISNILKIPCFVGYNYLYPIVFLPLYVYLLQSVVVAFRKKMGYENPSRLKDIIFLLCFCFGFNFFGLSASCGYWFNSIIVSESCFISVILMLLCIRITIALIEKHVSLVLYFIIPIFVIFISGAKISTGFIFYLAFSYFLFRTNPKSIRNWFAIILFTAVFIVCYKVFNDSVGGENGTPLYFFHSLRTHIQKKFWVFHYTFFLLPSLFIFKYHSKGVLFSKEYFFEKSNMWAEMAFLIMSAGFLPGILFEIGGGSGFYFYFPAFIISCLLLWGLNIHCEIYNALKQSNLAIFIFIVSAVFFVLSFFNVFVFVDIIALLLIFIMILASLKINIHIESIKQFNNMRYALFFFVFMALYIPVFKNSEIKTTVRQTLITSNKLSLHTISGRLPKLKQCFGKSDYIQDEKYIAIYNIRNMVNQNRSDYCLFLEDDCYLYNLYGNGGVPWYELKGNYAAVSLFGIPVINSLYTDGYALYRGDGKNIGTANQMLAYGLVNVQPYKYECTLENMKDYAYSLGKKFLIVLSGNTYKVISLELDAAAE